MKGTDGSSVTSVSLCLDGDGIEEFTEEDDSGDQCDSSGYVVRLNLNPTPQIPFSALLQFFLRLSLTR